MDRCHAFPPGSHSGIIGDTVAKQMERRSVDTETDIVYLREIEADIIKDDIQHFSRFIVADALALEG